MEHQLALQIKALRIYVIILTIALLILAALYCHQAFGTPHFKQIDAARINIVKEAGMVYSFDQYKNDQIMQLQYQQDSPHIRSYGLKMWDESDNFPLGPIVRASDSKKAMPCR